MRNAILAIALTGIFSLTQGESRAVSDPWPMMHHDTRNTGLSSYAGPTSVALAWSYHTGGGIYSSAAIGYDGRVYVGSQDNNLYAFDSDGSLAWSYPTGDDIYSSPLYNGIVGFGSNDGTYYALHSGGSLFWSYSTGSSFFFSSASEDSGSHIYAGCSDNTLYSFRPIGGERWFYPLGSASYAASPAVGDDQNVYISSDRLHVITSSGALVWSYATCNATSAIASDGTIYTGGSDNIVRAINSSGVLTWSYHCGTLDSFNAPAIDSSGNVYVVTNGQFMDFGRMFALSPTGSLRWSYAAVAISDSSSPALSANNVVYYGGGDELLYALDTDAGTPCWAYWTHGHIIASPAIGADGRIYLGSTDGAFYVLGPSEPTETPTISPTPTVTPTATSTPTVTPTPLESYTPSPTLPPTSEPTATCTETPEPTNTSTHPPVATSTPQPPPPHTARPQATSTPTPVSRGQTTLNQSSYRPNDPIEATLELNEPIEETFTVFAVIILPDGSMLNLLTLDTPIRPVAENVGGLPAFFTYPLLSMTIPPGAPAGTYEILVVFFAAGTPITGRQDAFLEISRTFTIE